MRRVIPVLLVVMFLFLTGCQSGEIGGLSKEEQRIEQEETQSEKEQRRVEETVEGIRRCFDQEKLKDMNCGGDAECNRQTEKYCGNFILENCELAAYGVICTCDIKGNISSDGRKIYHTKECLSYDDTEIDIYAGEKWFCDENEAVNTGWEPAGNCN